MNRLVAVLVLMPLLAGCNDGGQAKANALKRCGDQSMTKPMSQVGSFILSCMRAEGYVFDESGRHCDPMGIKDEDLDCYREQ